MDGATAVSAAAGVRLTDWAFLSFWAFWAFLSFCACLFFFLAMTFSSSRRSVWHAQACRSSLSVGVPTAASGAAGSRLAPAGHQDQKP